ncbi:CGNR zinc finger domain-containing protein [Streptomyces ferrugineus]|uniref:CGNR zinc finger domain-containing protein n=1 Tax=Streptomyces ferrugineus TaxID=1413221 RepID=A0A7M2SBS0_9ACTN|nr:CGNR zinc finger domain-containing protein [Streptomyces ferrugineus]QOV33185.1 CGNR zinc finger domain-containing protein [Streptomyces ferrugineus]
MTFAPDTVQSLHSAIALVNTAEPREALFSLEDLDRFHADYGYTGRYDRTTDELNAVRELRPRLRGLLTSTRDETVRLANRVFRETKAVPQLVRHGSFDWHIHAVEPNAPLTRRLLVETAMAVADVVRGNELDRLRICAAGDCQRLVLDLSRNHSRRFCSTTCGSRVGVAAYRERQRRNPAK